MKFLNLTVVILATSFAITCCMADTEKFMYDSKGKRDPFFPVSQAIKSDVGPKDLSLSPIEKLKAKGVHVSSIIWSENNPSILINDDILEVGQSFKGIVIRAIERDFVVFEVDGEVVEYPIN